jgi:hypothetical protein
LLFWISFPSASITAVARRRRGGAALWSEFNGQTMKVPRNLPGGEVIAIN